ncbi:uncharacterized protein CMU_034460 [Cryptosporidium muris RN66]|uniref:Uncharacterized protein n=1 Tax=Cryptosporidium muris (strain RN66) TaxID=441375 RepID=B6AFR9_CRYMR|nr:uncharacterized protein CMU_034460 [Cryptosporidium muris RN66]EEA07060.1 hypothetical protein, conserved [Cryptosporidium muris RN66]|eukprot:XP_002141409.1 hypothetical protein [Cryptosporidium muris RN66]
MKDSDERQANIEDGRFVLQQYKLRKELGLFTKYKVDPIKDICYKYEGVDLNVGEYQQKPGDSPQKQDIAPGEFERVLQELQRREVLIQDLLLKLETKELEGNTPEIYINTDRSSNLAKTKADEDLKGKQESQNIILLYKAIMNSVLNSSFVKECSSDVFDNIDKQVPCKHQKLLALYRREIIHLVEENNTLKQKINLSIAN